MIKQNLYIKKQLLLTENKNQKYQNNYVKLNQKGFVKNVYMKSKLNEKFCKSQKKCKQKKLVFILNI